MHDPFVEPPWDEPLDVDAALRRVPTGETIKGMFLSAMLVGARAKGVTLPGARERYIAFQDYPLREHAELLVSCSTALYPQLTLRRGLRRLGHHAQGALVDSTIGRVIWAAAVDAPTALTALAKAYKIAHPTSEVSVVDVGPGVADVRLARVWWFLDSHHVGCFEGALRAVGIEGTVTIRLSSWSAGEMRCTW